MIQNRTGAEGASMRRRWNSDIFCLYYTRSIACYPGFSIRDHPQAPILRIIIVPYLCITVREPGRGSWAFVRSKVMRAVSRVGAVGFVSADRAR